MKVRAANLLWTLLVGLPGAACTPPLGEPVVQNDSPVQLYARVGGIADNRATARVIELPSGVRTSLTDQAGLPELFLTDITLLDPNCSPIESWMIDDELFEGAIVVRPDRTIIRNTDDSGPPGTAAIVSDHCPPGPDIIP